MPMRSTVIALGLLLAACGKAPSPDAARSDEEQVRQTWAEFDAAVLRGDWPAARERVSRASGPLIDALVATTKEPPPEGLLIVDRVYETTFPGSAPDAAAPAPASIAHVDIAGAHATARLTGADAARVVDFVQEDRTWKVDLAATLNPR